MWFTNLKIYKLTEDFKLTDQELEEKLSQSQFTPCGSLQLNSFGWVPPIPRQGKILTHSIQDKVLVCAQHEEKLLPASVVNELLNDKLNEIEDETGHRPGRKHKMELKEELIHTLLPRAFTRSKRFYAYIDRTHNLLIVNAASSIKAEELTEFLRETIGSFPIVPFNPTTPAKDLLTTWLSTQEIPNDLMVGHSCVLTDTKEEGGSVRFSKQELLSEEIQSHIQSGKQVTKLALTWADKIQFNLADDMSIKQVKLTDLILDTRDVTHDDAAAQFDADFNIMAMEFGQFVPYLAKLFNI